MTDPSDLLPYIERILEAMDKKGEIFTDHSLISDYLPLVGVGDITFRLSAKGMSRQQKQALDEKPLADISKKLGMDVFPGERVVSVAYRLYRKDHS